jgi:hypothetical protein
MKGCLASVVIPDQPYDDSIAKIVGRGKIKHREFAHASGELSPEQFVTFQRKWMELCSEFSKPGSIHFVFIDWRHLTEALTAGQAIYSELKNVVVWCKTNGAQGSFYRSQHEFILVSRTVMLHTRTTLNWVVTVAIVPTCGPMPASTPSAPDGWTIYRSIQPLSRSQWWWMRSRIVRVAATLSSILSWSRERQFLLLNGLADARSALRLIRSMSTSRSAAGSNLPGGTQSSKPVA